MAQTTDDTISLDILAGAKAHEAFAAIPDAAEEPGRTALLQIAQRIGRTRRPGEVSDIPAGVTYFTQFLVHDLDFRGTAEADGGPRLDLALIYGDGPRHDAFAYQVPHHAGEPRSLLRVGRTRPTQTSPAWGAARDLPRIACPHLDTGGADLRTEVLVPNTLSDSNLILGQIQVAWTLLHNSLVSRPGGSTDRSAERFEAARRVARHVYRSAVINDVLGTWLLPSLRPRYLRALPDRLGSGPLRRLPAVFQHAVARLGHGLVREIYALNPEREVEGLRSVIRHTSLSRPGEMPLTEDWLVDFSRFFDIGGRTAQRARRLGPHIARPFGLGGGVGLDAPSRTDGLVLRDLVACTRPGMPSVRALLARISAARSGLLEGCFAQDEVRWQAALAEWLGAAEVEPGMARALSADPPLTLFLMLEAEADAAGQSLGALGSILMAETLAAALPDPAPAPDLARAEAEVFHGPAPASMAELIVFLQRHYQFADGARLHPAEARRSAAFPKTPTKPTEVPMLDDRTASGPAAGLVEVADYIELGRVVADWTRYPETRPTTVKELAAQLDGIAQVPESFREIQFVEGKSDVLVIRLPERQLLEQTMSRIDSLLVEDRYMLPKFYDDIYSRHFGPQMSALDTFLARVGDYTIAQCR